MKGHLATLKSFGFEGRIVRTAEIVARAGQGKFSVPLMAQKFGVSERTVRRDVEFLREVGLVVTSGYNTFEISPNYQCCDKCGRAVL